MDAEVHSIWIRGLDGDELGYEEEARYRDLMLASLRNFENAYYQYENGGLQEDQRRAFEIPLMGILRSTGGARLWLNFRPRFNDDFVALVQNELVSNSEGITGD